MIFLPLPSTQLLPQLLFLISTSSLQFFPTFLISMLHKKLLPVSPVPTSLSSHLRLKKKNPKGLDLKQFLGKIELLKMKTISKNNLK
jgi:hypothetical protein